MRRASTFIEIEIVVVIGIILVLISTFVPLGNRSRENARRSSCQSNLKQIGLGFMQYCRDYDEKYPLAYTDLDGVAGFTPSIDKGWVETVYPYIKSYAIFQCPSEINPPSLPAIDTDYWLSAPTVGLNDSQFSNRSFTVLFGDGIQSSTANLATHGAIAYTGDAPSLKYNGEIWDITEATEGKGARRHLNGMNFSFMDGHVKWLRPETVAADPISADKPTFRVK